MPQIATKDFSPRRVAKPLSGGREDSGSGLRRLLANPGLHELYAATHADCAAASGFALAVAQEKREGALIWVRHDLLQAEAGSLYPPGLLELGLSPASLTLVRAPTVKAVLQAGLEAARCSALSAVIVEFWGEAKAYDLTASRRLALAARGAKLRLLLVRHGAGITASAADTRWRVRALASQPLAANAPGRAAFEIELLRRRAGAAGQVWRVEWNDDAKCLAENLPLAGQPMPASQSGNAIPLRRTG
jgi:protein ImuA